MRKSANSLSPIAILPNTPPPARFLAQPETPTTPLGDASEASSPSLPGAGVVVVELPAGPLRPTSIRSTSGGSGSGSGSTSGGIAAVPHRFSSLLDPGDITPITSPLPNGSGTGSIYTIFGAATGPPAVGLPETIQAPPPGSIGRRRSSQLLPNSASNGSATSSANAREVGHPREGAGPAGTATSAKSSRSRRSSELSQQNWRTGERSASASVKSHASGNSNSRKRHSTHIEMNGPPGKERPVCLKSSFLRRKCKEYAGEFRGSSVVKIIFSVPSRTMVANIGFTL
uniref:Uncharacterized protein n=1 Tax=Anopheles albimanus TaxID=7167 RepID=A0A182FKQ6_ANOAL